MNAPSTVVITGASSGIGAAVARRLATTGAQLILVARRKDRLDALAQRLNVPCLVLPLDVRDREQMQQALQGLPEAFRNVSVLVNNAGGALGVAPAQEAQLDEWETMIDTNIKGVVCFTRLLLPGMIARGRGHVVNVGSVAGTYPYPGGNVYGATKAFLALFSQNLRADLLGTPVRVTNIEPGMVETEFSVVRFHGDPQKAHDVYRGMKPLTADDVAESICWSIQQPPHVNVSRIELMPVAQAFSGFAVHRTS